MWVEEEPTPELMYAHAYAVHTASFEINVQFYLGLMFLLFFIRQLLSFTVT